MYKLLKKLLGSAEISSLLSCITSSSSKITDYPELCSIQLQCSEEQACGYRKLLRDGSRCNTQYHAKEKKKMRKAVKGCVPVMVNGEIRMLFKVSRLGHPLISSLLQRTAHEMGYALQYSGALQLFCDPAFIPDLLGLATTT